MSAPVVRCWIDPESPDAVLAVGADRDLPALAVPEALFKDGLFIVRVIQRLAESYGHVAPSMMIEFLDAIHAELRARAGGAE